MNTSKTNKLDFISEEIKHSRVKAALVNLYIGDALSMPVHWFYNPVDILKAFPPHGITKMLSSKLYYEFTLNYKWW